MSASGGRAERREESSRPVESKGAAGSRPRGESGGQPGGAPPRPQHDSRRKRNTEQRYAGWGDEIERAFCARARPLLPTDFPIESRSGAATIPRTIVARRDGALLFCTFSHHGPHAWPDGEVVASGEEQGP